MPCFFLTPNVSLVKSDNEKRSESVIRFEVILFSCVCFPEHFVGLSFIT